MCLCLFVCESVFVWCLTGDVSHTGWSGWRNRAPHCSNRLKPDPSLSRAGGTGFRAPGLPASGPPLHPPRSSLEQKQQHAALAAGEKAPIRALRENALYSLLLHSTLSLRQNPQRQNAGLLHSRGFLPCLSSHVLPMRIPLTTSLINYGRKLTYVTVYDLPKNSNI